MDFKVSYKIHLTHLVQLATEWLGIVIHLSRIIV